MPIEVWVQAVHAGLKIVELPVPLIYLEEERSFGGSLDNAAIRFDYYRKCSIARSRLRPATAASRVRRMAKPSARE